MMERARRIAFAAAVTAALGFGAQVVAQPQHARDDAQACTDTTCARVCHLAGFSGGFCNSGGGCSCYL